MDYRLIERRMEFKVKVSDKVAEERLADVVGLFDSGELMGVLVFDIGSLGIGGAVAFGYAEDAV
jgi:hypothetical protein